MPEVYLSNAALANKVDNLVQRWSVREDEYKAWVGGAADGGPNSDGRFPVTDDEGVTHLVESPAKLASIVLDPAEAVQSTYAATLLAKDAAESAKSVAEDKASQASSSKMAAQDARDLALLYRDDAAADKAATASHRAVVEAIVGDFPTAMEAARDRSTHTGSQAIETVDGLVEELSAKVPASDLMLPAGASLVGFAHNGLGAVSRNLLDKVRETVSVEDFAPAGLAWNDDWTDVFTKAAVAVGPGGRVRAHGRYTLFSNPFIPIGVTISGPYSCPDQITADLGGDYDGRNGVVFIRATATGVNVNGDGGWEGLIIMREGLNLPFADASAATAGIAAFAGRAFNVAGPGATFRNLLILGFNQAIYSGGFERTRCIGVRGDCTNGIDIRDAYDVPELEDCHFWPYTTVHQTWTTNALLRRSGVAFYGQGVNDWMRYVRCFSFGYYRGFHGRDVNSVTFFLCGADNTSTTGVGDHAGSIGFVIDGTCEEPRWIGCQAAAQDFGFYYANASGKHGTAVACEAWGSAVAGLNRASGALTVSGGVFRNSPYGVRNEHASDILQIDKVRFNAIGTLPIHSTLAASGLQIGANDFGNWTVGTSPVSANLSLPTVASADPLLLPATGDKFIVTGTTSFGSVNGMWPGRRVTLHFTGALTVYDGGSSIKLAGDMVTGGSATLTIEHDGATSVEISRAAV